MDNQQIIIRIEQLLKEKHMTYNELKENTSLSTTIYQWKKNRKRDATRTPSFKSIEKICAFFKISLSEFFATTEEELYSVKQKELLIQIKKLSERELEMVMNFVKMLNESKE